MSEGQHKILNLAADHARLLIENARLQTERDELVAAAKALCDFLDNEIVIPNILAAQQRREQLEEALRAAIAKAEEGGTS